MGGLVLAVAWGVSPTQPVVAATFSPTTFADLQQTTSTCTGANTVVLPNDVSGTGALSIDCDLVLDLNGHNLTVTNVVVAAGKTFEVTDSTPVGGTAGKLTAGPHAASAGIDVTGATFVASGTAQIAALTRIPSEPEDNPAPGIGWSGSNTASGAVVLGGSAVVQANGGGTGAGIGGGASAGGGTVQIGDDARVTARGYRGAAIGSGQQGSAVAVSISGRAVVDATGVSNAAGIGGGMEAQVGPVGISGDAVVVAKGAGGAGVGYGAYAPSSGPNPVVTVADRAHVEATGFNYAAGIGGGFASRGVDLTVASAASVVAVADRFSAAIGNGALYAGTDGSTVTIAGAVTASAGVSALGNGIGPFVNNQPTPSQGSLAVTVKSGGVLRLPTGPLVIPDSNASGAEITVEQGGRITGSADASPTYATVAGPGQILNDGVIDMPTANVTAAVQHRNYQLSFDLNGASGAVPSPIALFADTVSRIGMTLPAAPSRVGFAFAGWNTKADGSGATVATSTDLTAVLPDAPGTPTSQTLYAQWSLMTSVTTFDDLAVVADSCTSPTTVRLDASFNVTGRLFVDCDLTIDIAGRSVRLGGITVRSGTLTITDTTPSGQPNGTLYLGGVALPGTDLVITGRAHVVSDAPFGQNGSGLGNIANEPGASITIDSAATVAATSRGTGPAIGGASVTIRGSAVVNATSYGTGAAIGGGDGQATAPITIGGTARVTAMGSFGGTGGAAIGTGRGGTWAGDVTISDNANVDATGGTGAAAIGGGQNVGGGVVRIGTGTTVYAVGLGPVAGSRSTGATIGAGADADGGTVTIAGSVTLQSFASGLGVGLGPDGVASRRFGTVTIATGGRVNGPAPLFVTESDPNGPELIIAKGGFVAVTRSILGGTTTGQILNDGAISLGSASVSVPVQHRNYRFSLVLDAGQAPFLTTLVLADTVSAASAFLPEPFARAGFAFGGWNTKADGSGATISATTDLTTILADAPGVPTAQTLYAIWVPLTSVSTFSDLSAVLGGCTDTDPPLTVKVTAPISAASSELEVNCNAVLDLAGNDVKVRNVVIGTGKTFELTDSTPVASQTGAGTFTADASAAGRARAGIRTSGASLRISGTAVIVAKGASGSSPNGAGIGASGGGAPGPVTIADHARVFAQGAAEAPGIGGLPGGTVVIGDYAEVEARGGAGAPGVGAGPSPGNATPTAGDLTVRGHARLLAVGDSTSAPGIGSASPTIRGSVTILDEAVVTASGETGVGSGDLFNSPLVGPTVTVAGTLIASGTVSALGRPAGGGMSTVALTVKSGGVVRLPSGQLVLPDLVSGPEITVEPGGLITGSDAPLPTYATISGAGQIQNGGRILMPALNVGVPVTKRNYAISFDLNGAAGSPPSSMTVFADTVINGGRVFPADPVRPGFTFLGWNTKANGSGTAVTAATDLTTVLADAPGTATAQTLYAQWSPRQSVDSFADLHGIASSCTGFGPSITVRLSASVSAPTSTLTVTCNLVVDLAGYDLSLDAISASSSLLQITDTTSAPAIAGLLRTSSGISASQALVIDGRVRVSTTGAAGRPGLTSPGLRIDQSAQVDATGGAGAPGIEGSPTIRGAARITAKGGEDAAGIGSGPGVVGGAISIDGTAVVEATGGSGGAGIGSGRNAFQRGDIVIRSAAVVTARGGDGGAGIGPGAGGAGNAVFFEDTAQVTAIGGGGPTPGSAVGGRTSFGSVRVNAQSVLRVPSGSVIVPDSNASGAEMTVAAGAVITGSDAPSPTYASITGSGQIQNSGRILMPAANVSVPVTKRNYRLSFDLNGAAGSTPSPVTVFADTVTSGGRVFPADPVRPGFTFLGWNTKANGSGTAVTGTTDLTALLADAPGAATAQTLYAQWQIKSSATTVEDLIGIAGGCTSATTLTLPVDMTTTSRLFVSCDLTIDLAGHSLSVGAVTVPTNAKLRITDSTADKSAAGLFTVARGLQVAGGSVTIDGTARVRATGDGSVPAIGPGPGLNGAVLIGGDATVVATGDGTAGNSNAGIGGAVTIQGRANVTATGSVGAAGIGSRKETNQTQAILIQGSAVVTATGGAGAAGIGSGEAGNAGTITIGAGTTVTATGTGVQFPGPAGIGGGAYGAGGVVTISGTVTASSPFSAVGGGSSDNGVVTTGFGLVTIRSGGVLRVPSGEVRIPDTFSGASEFVVDAGGLVAGSVPDANGASTYAMIRGGSATTGQISNSGVITLPSANVLVPVTRRNYALSFDLNGAAGTAPGSVTLFADTVTNGGRVFPTSPSRPGFTFAGWNTKADGTGSTVTASTDLTQLLANAPGTATAQTLYAQWTPLSSVSTVADLVGLLAGCTAVDPPLQVTVTADLDLSSSELVSNCNVVLDLNGHDVSVRDVVVKPGTTLEVTDSSTAPMPPGVFTVDASGTPGLPGITNGGAELVVSGRATVSVVGGAGASAIGASTNGLGTVTVKDGATLRLPSGQLVVPDSNSGTKPEIVVEKGGVISGSGGASPTYASIVGPGGGAPSGSISNAGVIDLPAANVQVPVSGDAFVVSFDLSGGSSNGGTTPPAAITVFAGSVAGGGASFPADPTRDGFVFTGWAVVVGGVLTPVTASTDLSVFGSADGSPVPVVLIAQWQPIPVPPAPTPTPTPTPSPSPSPSPVEADLPSASVTITGGSAPLVGQPLTASVLLASPVTGLVVAWQWSRVVDGVATSIEGETGSSYTPSADDVGAVLRATASLSASGYRSGSASADTSPVAAAGLPALRLAVKGKTRVGRVVNGALTGLPSVDEVPGLSVAWSWQRISRKGTVRSVPSAAGLPAFRKLTRADRGKRLRVTAVVTAPGYDTVTVSRTTKVVRKGRIAKPDVRIVRDGVVLVATVAGLSGLSTAVPGLAVSYRWRDASGRGLGDGKRLVVPSGYVGRIVLLVRLVAPGYETRRVARSYRYGGGR